MALARVASDHTLSIEADLRNVTGHGIEDLGEELSWQSAYAVVKTLPLDSALARELQPDGTIWSSRLKTNMLLADIVDLLAGIMYVTEKLAGGRPHKPKPLDRPGSKQKRVQHYGRDALPMDKLKQWIFSRKKT